MDSEVMLNLVQEAGHTVVPEEADAEIIVVNTCCFIHDAKEESIETILEMAQYKEEGSLKGLLVCGCLAQRYQEEILEEIPEVDGILGTGAYDKIVEAIDAIASGSKKTCVGELSPDFSRYQRAVSTITPYAYLKIAEGCDNHCTYCIIPSLRGKYKSRPLEDILEEARSLAHHGKKELILIAQDTACYGMDLYGEKRLPFLLKELCAVEGLEWVRLLYCYPEHITDELIEVMKEEKKICHYIDMPIQHSDDQILKRMGRKTSANDLQHVIQKLRQAMPDISIRTTLITGFPGEDEKAFTNLKTFVAEMTFDRLGVFPYSREEGTPAYDMPNQVDSELAVARKEEIMALQQKISLEKNKAVVGQALPVLIEGYLPDDEVYAGRCYKDAPDIDGLVFVETDAGLMAGDLIPVLITSCSEYDLSGVPIDANESGQ